MPTLAVDGDRSIYYEHTAGRNPAVLFSHGFGSSGRVWDDTRAFLADRGWGTAAYDHRGCGLSSKTFDDVSIEAQGRDVAAICNALALDRVVLNGWSLGGAVVVDAAVKLGARVAGIVLTAGATPRYTQAEGFPHGGTAADVEATVQALRAGRAAFLHGLYFENVFAKPVPDAVKHWCWQLAMQAAPTADAALGALARLDQRALLPKIGAPALVVAGEADAVVPAGIARDAATRLPQAQLLELPGCGHAPFLEDAAAYHDALAAFLEGIAKRGNTP